ncbi:hypothetical protein SprV_0602207100 [Sparganum proliferum]
MASLGCTKTALLSDPSCRQKDLTIETIGLPLQNKCDEKDNRLEHVQVLQLLNFCLTTYFTFDGIIYEQVKGPDNRTGFPSLIKSANRCPFVRLTTMSGACGMDGSQSSKNSLEAMENMFVISHLFLFYSVKQQVAAIGQLNTSLSALEKENERLAAEQRAIESSTVKAEAEALRRFVASEFRLAQAHTFLPYKRARLCLSSVSTEATTTTPVSTLDYLHCGGLLSPALSALYRAAIEHAKVTKTKLKQSFDDLTAWKFSPDSPSGKRLMTCMRQLLAKNEGLGRVNEADRLTALESEAAMQATCIEEFLKTNQELESVLEESSFDLEGLQSSLLILKQQLCLAQSLLDDLKVTCTIFSYPLSQKATCCVV